MSGVAIITEACIGTKDRGCVDVCPVQCIYEFDPVNNVLFSEVEAGNGEIENSHAPNPDAIAIFADTMLYVNTDECTSCTACYQPRSGCPTGRRVRHTTPPTRARATITRSLSSSAGTCSPTDHHSRSAVASAIGETSNWCLLGAPPTESVHRAPKFVECDGVTSHLTSGDTPPTTRRSTASNASGRLSLKRSTFALARWAATPARFVQRGEQWRRVPLRDTSTNTRSHGSAVHTPSRSYSPAPMTSASPVAQPAPQPSASPACAE